jgi:hypothetical protein
MICMRAVRVAKRPVRRAESAFRRRKHGVARPHVTLCGWPGLHLTKRVRH